MSVTAKKTGARSSPWRPAVVTAFILATALLSGCNMSKLRGGNFRDEFANWGEKNHRPGTPDEMWGMSERARQVERNLGVD